MKIKIVDHENNEFSSIAAMCRNWGISDDTYIYRIKQGWSIRDALTIPIGSKNSRYITIIDHKENKFSSVEAMCKYWNISRAAYEGRIKQGWSKKDALTIPIKSNSKSIIDHEGNVFPSIKEMCKYWNISHSAYSNRIKQGWSIKKTLTTPIGSIIPSSKAITDHKGNKFSSITKMCKCWNITIAIYNRRIKLGWSKKDALTIPVGSKTSKRITDHEGNEFPSIKEMCKHWKISDATYKARLKLGWSLQKTLTTIPKNTNICDGYTVLYQIDYCEDEGNEINYYMCSIKGIGGPILRAFEDIFNDMLQLRETGHIDLIDAVQKGNIKGENNE